ncbi:MAG: hypothetical protein ACJAVT_002012 [Yoonia sp.]|jgi:hypothetical protein
MYTSESDALLQPKDRQIVDHRKLDSKEHAYAGKSREVSATNQLAAKIARDISFDLDSKILPLFHNAVLSPDPKAFRQIISDLVANGVSTIDLANFLIPEIAYEPRDQWSADEIIFASEALRFCGLHQTTQDDSSSKKKA